MRRGVLTPLYNPGSPARGVAWRERNTHAPPVSSDSVWLIQGQLLAYNTASVLVTYHNIRADQFEQAIGCNHLTAKCPKLLVLSSITLSNAFSLTELVVAWKQQSHLIKWVYCSLNKNQQLRGENSVAHEGFSVRRRLVLLPSTNFKRKIYINKNIKQPAAARRSSHLQRHTLIWFFFCKLFPHLLFF